MLVFIPFGHMCDSILLPAELTYKSRLPHLIRAGAGFILLFAS